MKECQTIEKQWHTQNFDFLSLKSSSAGQFLENSNSIGYIEFSNLLLQLKNQESERKTVVYF